MKLFKPFDHGKEKLYLTDEELAEEIELLRDAERSLAKLGNRYDLALNDIRMNLSAREGFMSARKKPTP